jgi:hypothetical protein
MTDIYVPKTVESIGQDAFLSCSALAGVQVDENNAEYMDIEGVLFSKDGTKLIVYPSGKIGEEYVIPKEVLEISQRAFCIVNCLKTISFEEGTEITKIGSYAFRSVQFDCQSFIIPSSVEVIEEYAFYSCSGIGEFLFESGSELREIEDYGFYCNSFNKIYLPDSLLTIGKNAFYYSTNAAFYTITIPQKVLSIGENAFQYCNLTIVYIDSAEVAEGLENSDSMGKLIAKANSLFIEKGITVSDYVASAYTLHSSGDKYNYYIKN